MGTVLSISSQVVRGHVGNSAVAPAMRALGHDVWPVPTVILSNHPGHGSCAGVMIQADDMEAMLVELWNSGWLTGCDAVLTGYFRDRTQVAAAAELIRALKGQKTDLLYCCDPVIGDHPGGLYVAEEIAVDLREQLLPLADMAVPNRFELEWLSGRPADTVRNALQAAKSLGLPDVTVTSVPAPDDHLAVARLVGSDAFVVTVDRLKQVPHGIGDLTTAFVLAGVLNGETPGEGLGNAVARSRHVLAASHMRDELNLTDGLFGIDGVRPIPSAEIRV